MDNQQNNGTVSFHVDDVITQRNVLGQRCFDLELVIAAKDRRIKELESIITEMAKNADQDI